MAQIDATIDAGAEQLTSRDVEDDHNVRATDRVVLWRRILPAVACLAVYVVLTGLDFGPLRLISSGVMTGPRTADQIAQIWWIAWAHSSLAHGVTPFFTDWQNYPVGMNFGLNGSIFGLTIPFAPVTAAFGPIVSWDLLLRLAPIASALSMCLVLRRWTSWWPAAFAGGLLYGFSTYVLFNADGYLFLAFVPLPPIIFLLVAEIVDRQRWRPVVAGALLAVVCGVQYLISSEILASTAMMAVLGALVYLVHNRKSLAAKLRYMIVAGIAAAATSVLTLGYSVWFTFAGRQHAHGPPNSPTALATLHGDLAGVFVPGGLQRLSTPSTVSLWENHLHNATMMYVGIPLFVAVAVTVYLLRSKGIVLLAGLLAAVAFVLSLGSVLYVAGVDTHIPLPFVILANFPILEGLLSSRFSLFTDLFAAAVIAFGVEELHRRLLQREGGGSRRRVLAAVVPLVLVGVVALPILPAHVQKNTPTGEAAVFGSKQLASIPRGSVLLGYPYPHTPFAPTGPGGTDVHTLAPTNELLVNQAVSGMRFKLIGGFGWRPTKGYYGTAGPSNLTPQSVQALFDVSFFGAATQAQSELLDSADLPSDIRTFVQRYHVDTIVVLPIGAHPEVVVKNVTAALGPPDHIDGAAVWLDLQNRGSS